MLNIFTCLKLNFPIFAAMKRLLVFLFFLPLFTQAQFKITVSRAKDPIYFRGTLFDEKNFLAKDPST